MLTGRGLTVWLTIEGIALLVLGFLALVVPAFTGLAATIVFGWLLLIAGGVGLASSFGAGAHAHKGLSLASAIVALACGVLLLIDPVAGAAGLTLLLAVYLLLDGVTSIGLAYQHRHGPGSGWIWLGLAGLLDLLLAFILAALTPHASAGLLGIIVAADLVFAGIALLLFNRGAGELA